MQKLLFRSFFHSRHSCSSSQFPLIAIVGIYLFSFGAIYSFSLFYPDVEKKARSHFFTPQIYFQRKKSKSGSSPGNVTSLSNPRDEFVYLFCTFLLPLQILCKYGGERKSNNMFRDFFATDLSLSKVSLKKTSPGSDGNGHFPETETFTANNSDFLAQCPDPLILGSEKA